MALIPELDLLTRLKRTKRNGVLHKEAADEIERLQQLCDARQSHLEEGGRIIDGLRQQLEHAHEECANWLEDQDKKVLADYLRRALKEQT